MLQRIYDWTLSLAGDRRSPWALALVSFSESSVFPIPPDVILIPMIIAKPYRAFFYAGICTLASVAGGIAGYYIGAQLFEHAGRPIIEFYGQTEQFADFSARFATYGNLAVLIAGLTPFPYKVITIASGFSGLPFAGFVLWSTLARGLRFFIVAALLWKFGVPVRAFVEKRLGLLTGLFFFLLIAGFIVAAKI